MCCSSGLSPATLAGLGLCPPSRAAKSAHLTRSRLSAHIYAISESRLLQSGRLSASATSGWIRVSGGGGGGPAPSVHLNLGFTLEENPAFQNFPFLF